MVMDPKALGSMYCWPGLIFQDSPFPGVNTLSKTERVTSTSPRLFTANWEIHPPAFVERRLIEAVDPALRETPQTRAPLCSAPSVMV